MQGRHDDGTVTAIRKIVPRALGHHALADLHTPRRGTLPNARRQNHMEAELPRPYRVGLDGPRHGKVLQTLAAGHERNADHIGRSARYGTRHVERVDRTRTSGTDGLHYRQAEARGRENPGSQRAGRSGTEGGKRRAEN